MNGESGGSDPTRILVAEDDREFLSTLEFWLSDGDTEVIGVTDGQSAIEEIDETVDVFLCDQYMPRLTGPEVLEQMNQSGYDVPTIVISAYDPEFRDHDVSVDQYLSKPIDKTDLLDVVDQLLTG